MNYSLVINSQFKPYELSELIPLYQANTQAQSAAEEQAVALQSQADMYKNEALKNPNSRAAQIYNNYANDLQKQADDLLNNGLNANNRKGLLAMRSRYAGEIGNIAKAVAAMQENNKLVTSASMNDPTSMYWKYNNDLDNYLDGNTPDIHRVSGKSVQEDAMKLAAANSSRKYSKRMIQLDKYYNALQQQQGYTNEEIEAMKKKDGAYDEFIKDLKTAYGYDNLSAEDQKRFYSYAINGLNMGFTGKTDINPMQNREAVTPMERRAMALQEKMSGVQYNPKTGEYDIVDPNKFYGVGKDVINSNTGMDGFSSDNNNSKPVPRKYIKISKAKDKYVDMPAVNPDGSPMLDPKTMKPIFKHYLLDENSRIKTDKNGEYITITDVNAPYKDWKDSPEFHMIADSWYDSTDKFSDFKFSSDNVANNRANDEIIYSTVSNNYSIKDAVQVGWNTISNGKINQVLDKVNTYLKDNRREPIQAKDLRTYFKVYKDQDALSDNGYFIVPKDYDKGGYRIKLPGSNNNTNNKK